jgi:DNA-binding transcriptional regulator LsrR (DeoR family)
MSEPVPLRLDDLVLAATVARRYFLEDRTKVQIASEMHLSRFKVARLLDLARSSGIVRIAIATPGAVDAELSVLLREGLGLGRAIVVNTVDDDEGAAREHLADVAATLLSEVLTPADVLGLGWSRAVLETAARLCRPDRPARLPPCTVVQLTGGLTRQGVTASLIDAVDRLARRGGGRGYTFYAPMFVSDPASVDVIRRQPETAAAFARFPDVTRAVIGIGCWQPVSSNLHDALTVDERGALRRDHVLADLSGTFLDTAGKPLTMPLSRQVIGISAEQLHAVPDVICIAYGRNKAPAVRAAVGAGYVTTLVTTAALAQELLTAPIPPTKG